MDKHYEIVVIGAGHAAQNLIKFIRMNSDTDISIALLCYEDHHIYSKPRLSSSFSKHLSWQNLVQEPLAQWARKNKVDLFNQHYVDEIDSEQQCVRVKKEAFFYKKLILCLGAETLYPEELNALAKDLDWQGLNSLRDFSCLEEKLKHSEHKKVTVLGAGLIACEIANDLALSGKEVDVISLGELPLQRYLPGEISVSLRDSLAKQGVNWHLNQSVRGVCPKGGIITEKNTLKPSCAHILACGLQPRIALAKNANLKVNRGIVCNEYLETNKENIFALGDCAEQQGQVNMYIQAITIAAKSLAKTLTGTPQVVSLPPMPVTVKTQSLPLSFISANTEGNWLVEKNENGMKALYRDQKNSLLGFALSGKEVMKSRILTKEIA